MDALRERGSGGERLGSPPANSSFGIAVKLPRAQLACWGGSTRARARGSTGYRCSTGALCILWKEHQLVLAFASLPPSLYQPTRFHARLLCSAVPTTAGQDRARDTRKRRARPSKSNPAWPPLAVIVEKQETGGGL